MNDHNQFIDVDIDENMANEGIFDENFKQAEDLNDIQTSRS